MAEGLFKLGRVQATPAAITVMVSLAPDGDHRDYAAQLLARHHRGDWGDLPQAACDGNLRAVENDDIIASAYNKGHARLMVVTNADRKSTTIMVPREYP